jgi:hypothetical protein
VFLPANTPVDAFRLRSVELMFAVSKKISTFSAAVPFKPARNGFNKEKLI